MTVATMKKKMTMKKRKKKKKKKEKGKLKGKIPRKTLKMRNHSDGSNKMTKIVISFIIPMKWNIRKVTKYFCHMEREPIHIFLSNTGLPSMGTNLIL
jgi:hypothetical protein